MKVIKIETCNTCPYIYHDDGGGHCESFVICNRYAILFEKYKDFDINKSIHPDCRLEDA
jgi:hypothetical protein